MLANRNNNKRAFLSIEVYEILDEAAGNQCSIQELLDTFEMEEDKSYLFSILEKLLDAEMIQQEAKTNTNIKYETASLILTNRCNLSCIHCCQDAGGDKNTDELGTEEWLCIIDKIKKLKIQTITVTGGEVLLRKDMEQISRYLRKGYEGHLVLITNGTLINAENAKYLAELYDHISISMDGCNEELTNFIRGKGVYEKVLGAINILHDEGYKNISLSAILPNSLEVEKEFEGMCEKLEVKPEVRCLSKKGRGGKNYALIQRKFEEYVKKKNIRSMYLKKAKLRPT